MKINKTKILIYTEEKGLIEFSVSDYPIHLNPGDTINIIGTFHNTGFGLTPSELESISSDDLHSLIVLRNAVKNLVLGFIKKKRLKQIVKDLGVFRNDNVSTP